MIIVSSLKDLETVCESTKPSHVISVIDPGYEPKTPKGVRHHLKLGFDDIINVSKENKIFRSNVDAIPQLPPNIDHVKKIVTFSNTWNHKSTLVIHCWCGVSRSMATASYIMCMVNSENIDRNIRYIRSVAPHANPNKVLIKLFEESLGLDREISLAFSKYPHTIAYDCSINFAPVTIFNINDMKGFK